MLEDAPIGHHVPNESEPETEYYGIGDMAGDAAALLDALDINEGGTGGREVGGCALKDTQAAIVAGACDDRQLGRPLGDVRHVWSTERDPPRS